MQKIDRESDGVIVDLDTGTVIGTNVRWCPLMRLTDPEEDVKSWAERHGKAVFVE